MKNSRHFSPLDQLIATVDNGLRTVFGEPIVTERPNPASNIEEGELTSEQRKLAGRLMRINHAGEVSAQGLYQGQSITARLPKIRREMERAALEENDHLAWCESRAKELGTHVSLMNPLWYMGSLTIGAIAGLAGDKWSLGFVVETEHQVVKHLDEHMAKITPKDEKSQAILQQMKEDEAHHATVALHAGGSELPLPVKGMMKLTSKIMTKTTYWV